MCPKLPPPISHHNGFVSKEFSMHVCIFECESTGGSEWVLEQTIHLDDLVKVGSVLDSRVSVDSILSFSSLPLCKDAGTWHPEAQQPQGKATGECEGVSPPRAAGLGCAASPNGACRRGADRS